MNDASWGPRFRPALFGMAAGAVAFLGVILGF
jgi:hypothetical protein